MDPDWDDEFVFDSGVIDAENDVLTVKVFSDKGKDKVLLGQFDYAFKNALENPFTDDWFPVMKPGKPVSLILPTFIICQQQNFKFVFLTFFLFNI